MMACMRLGRMRPALKVCQWEPGMQHGVLSQLIFTLCREHQQMLAPARLPWCPGPGVSMTLPQQLGRPVESSQAFFFFKSSRGPTLEVPRFSSVVLFPLFQ